MKSNNRPKQSEIIISCRSIVQSKEKTPYKIAWFFETPVLFYTILEERGAAYPREGARSRQWKRFHPEASHVATTCTQRKPRYAPRNFHSRPRSSVIPPLRFRFLPAAFLKPITLAIYRAVGHYTLSLRTRPKITRERYIYATRI